MNLLDIQILHLINEPIGQVRFLFELALLKQWHRRWVKQSRDR